MNAPEQKKPPRPGGAVLASLNQSFKVFAECRPLAVGIHKAIRERQPEIGMPELRLALRSHTASTRYLKALSQAEARFDLDGNPAGEVTAEQRQQATDTLRERFRKKAEQHRAEQKEKELEKQRQDKLVKLAAKFNSR